jgi:hypothetical protein
MPYRQAGFYPVICLSTKKVGVMPPAPLFHGPCFGSFLGDWLWNVLIIGKPFKPTKLHFTMRSELTLFNLNLSLVNFTRSPPHQATPPATTPQTGKFGNCAGEILKI